MSFAQEMKDFVSGWGAVEDIYDKKNRTKIAGDTSKATIKKYGDDEKYRQSLLKLKEAAGGRAAANSGAAAGARAERAAAAKTNADRNYELARRRVDLAEGAAAGARAERAAAAKTNADRNYELARRRVDLAEGAAAQRSDAFGAKQTDLNMNAAIGGVPDSPASADDFGELDSYADPGAAPADPNDDPLSDVSRYAHGGLVQVAADGAMVRDPRDPAPSAIPTPAPAAAAPAPAPAPASAIPVTSPGNTPAAATPAAPAAPAASARPAEAFRPTDPGATKVIVQSGAEAAAEAMKSFTDASKEKPSAVGGADQTIDIHTNKGGMTHEEFGQILKTIDPDNLLPPHLKAVSTMGAAYQYFTAKGQPDKRLRAVKGLMVNIKDSVQTLGTLGVNALKDGHVEEGCKLLNDACNRFPTGHQIVVTPDDKRGATYEVFDGSKLVERGAMDQSQLIATGLKVADGSLFMEEVARFATSAKKAAAAGSGMAPALEAVTTAATDLNAAKTKLDTLDPTSDGYKAAFKAASEAKDQLTKARKEAIALGGKGFTGKGSRASYDAQIVSAINSAANPRTDTSLPDDPANAPPEEPGFLSRAGSAIARQFTGEPAPSAIPTTEAPAAPAAASATAPASAGAAGDIPTVSSPEEAMKLPPGTRFKTPDGRIKVR